MGYCRGGTWNLSSVSSVKYLVGWEEYQILLSVKIKIGQQVVGLILDAFSDMVLGLQFSGV